MARFCALLGLVNERSHFLGGASADFNADLARVTGKPPELDALALDDLNALPFCVFDIVGYGGRVVVACVHGRGQQNLLLQFDGPFAAPLSNRKLACGLFFRDQFER